MVPELFLYAVVLALLPLYRRQTAWLGDRLNPYVRKALDAYFVAVFIIGLLSAGLYVYDISHTFIRDAPCSIPGVSSLFVCPSTGDNSGFAPPPLLHGGSSGDLAISCQALGDEAPGSNEELLSHLFSVSLSNNLAASIPLSYTASEALWDVTTPIHTLTLEIDAAASGLKEVFNQVERIVKLGDETLLHWNNMIRASERTTALGFLCARAGRIADTLHICAAKRIPAEVLAELNDSLSGIRSTLQEAMDSLATQSTRVAKLHSKLLTAWQAAWGYEYPLSWLAPSAWKRLLSPSSRHVDREHCRELRRRLAMTTCATEVAQDALRRVDAALTSFAQGTTDVESQSRVHTMIALMSLRGRAQATIVANRALGRLLDNN